MAYRHIPHTADVTLEATGSSIPEAFSEMAKAFSAVMTESEVKHEVSHPLSLPAESLDALLFEFVGELVLLLDTEAFIPSHVEVDIAETNGVWRLEGHVHGDSVHSYEHRGDVKAPTYHELSVEQEGDNWVARITVDL